MHTITIREQVELPVEEVWELFVDLENYPKYFKYVNKIFYKENMQLGSVWHDFATFVVPIVIKHRTTVFEKEKKLGFDVSIPIKGYVIERINFIDKGESTEIEATIEYHFGNVVFNRLFKRLFEKRITESINEAVARLTQDLSLKN